MNLKPVHEVTPSQACCGVDERLQSYSRCSGVQIRSYQNATAIPLVYDSALKKWGYQPLNEVNEPPMLEHSTECLQCYGIHDLRAHEKLADLQAVLRHKELYMKMQATEEALNGWHKL